MEIAQLKLEWQEGKGKQGNEIAAIAKVHTEWLFKRTGEKTEEDRYFITTLTDARKVLRAVRSHWGVESMHWVSGRVEA